MEKKISKEEVQKLRDKTTKKLEQEIILKPKFEDLLTNSDIKKLKENGSVNI